MPVLDCGQTSVLTGQDGMITMKPPGTLACLKDFTDFPVPVSPATFSLIKIPPGSDFRVGDPITFTEEGTGNLDSGLTAGTVYYIKTRPTPDKVSISATQGGAGIALTGNGGSGTADTPGAGNHIEMSFAAALAMCEVPNVTLTLTRGEIDRTAIPCKPASTGSGPKLAQFRSFQPGFADGSGTLTLGTAATGATDAVELAATITTIDLGGASGTTTIFVDALNPTVTGGSGNDTININAASKMLHPLSDHRVGGVL